MSGSEPDQPGETRQAALERRKQEMEAELEAYAERGAFSPGLVKGARWFSRVLWFVLIAVLMVSLWDGWGKVPREDYDRAVKSANDWHKKATEREKAAADIALELALAQARAQQAAQIEVGEQPKRADEAAREARNLVARVQGELAYARHWRELLARAEPEGHGDDPPAVARGLIQQAAKAAAAQRFELLRELADLGQTVVTAEAAKLLAARGTESGVAALVLSRAGDASALPLLAAAVPQASAVDGLTREIWFAHSALALQTGNVPARVEVFLPEYWLASAMRGYEVTQKELAAAVREAPVELRLELMALLAECSGAGPESEVEEFMRAVAGSQRPGAERILAVRWLGRAGLARELLKGLASGDDPVATEAAEFAGE